MPLSHYTNIKAGDKVKARRFYSIQIEKASVYVDV